ncbi:hypothetical protein BU17DRAFT_66776 [Hysterangium stoloniferum]|nr:hypothetical protein BU17DRAFT_66776 [Hysterangium stoloniferum]
MDKLKLKQCNRCLGDTLLGHEKGKMQITRRHYIALSSRRRFLVDPVHIRISPSVVKITRVIRSEKSCLLARVSKTLAVSSISCLPSKASRQQLNVIDIKQSIWDFISQGQCNCGSLPKRLPLSPLRSRTATTQLDNVERSMGDSVSRGQVGSLLVEWRYNMPKGTRDENSPVTQIMLLPALPTASIPQTADWALSNNAFS